MGLFSESKPKVEPVPVFTIQEINRNYEVVGTVCAECRIADGDPTEPMRVLGRSAAEYGADAVLGLQGVYAGRSSFATFYGTMIKYVGR